MLDDEELVQVRQYVIKILPELIRAEPEIATTIEGILAEHFPRRDELARMLEKVDRNYEAISQHREETKQRFEQVDQRFEQVDQRFEQVDQRFEQVDQRFEQVDQRFEQVDQRFEQVDQRFEQVDHTIAELREDMNLRFEQIDRNFGEVKSEQLQMRRDIAKIYAEQTNMNRRMEGMEKWVKFVTGDLRNEKGQTMEDMFAAALRYGLKNPDIKPEHIHLRQRLVDTEGLVFPKGFETDIDIIAQNDEILVFEVKSTAKKSEVEMHAVRTQLVALQNPAKKVRGIFITLAAHENIRQRCADLGIELVD
jgi:hypothetical protein